MTAVPFITAVTSLDPRSTRRTASSNAIESSDPPVKLTVKENKLNFNGLS